MNWGDARLPDRFWDKVLPCPMSGCWLWTGSLTSDGYGRAWNGRRLVSPQQMAFIALGLEIAAGHQLDHLCRVTCCCNPLHVEAVTPQTNSLRSLNMAARFAGRSHCVNGHELTVDNVSVSARKTPGHRPCLTCKRLRGVETARRGRERKSTNAL